MEQPGLYRRAVFVIAAMMLVSALAACGGADSGSGGDSGGSGAATDEPAQVPSGPVRVIEHIEAASKDGVLFDLKLSLPVFDRNDSKSRRDDAEVVAPGKTEYQGIFNDGPGTLLIVSCFADVCQTDAKTVRFEVHYWVESAPDPLPEGVILPGG